MKDRDEFLASVYAKRDAALKEQKKKKKRMTAVLSTAAACLVLMVGLTQTDILDIGAVFSSGDSAAEGMNESVIIYDGAQITEDGMKDVIREDDARKDIASAPSSVQPTDQDAPDQDDAAPGQSYYMLPCVTIECMNSEEGWAMHSADMETTEKVQAWVDGLAENGQVLRSEEEALLNGDEIYYIVTIEREPQQKEIYYLTGEVGWYE